MFRCSSIKLLILIVTASSATLLPEYFKKCSLSDPKLNTCLTKNAIEAWPSMLRGDKNVHLQELDPLKVPFFHVEINNRFFSNVTNSIVNGLKDIKFNEIKLDKDKHVFDIYFLVPHFNVLGTYDIKGELINLQLEGQGSLNNSLHNMDSHLHIEYELIEENNKHYINPVKSLLKYNTTLLTIDMKQLGEMINLILNENWELLNKEISEALGNVFGEIYTEVLKSFFKKVSFEELFSE